MNPASQALPARRRVPWAIRIPATIGVSVLLGWLCGVAMRADARLQTPPGFFRGLLHGAMMPVAWPALLVGHDQAIYSEINQGRIYKLGYSMGVNLSGMVFIAGPLVGLGALRRRPGP